MDTTGTPDTPSASVPESLREAAQRNFMTALLERRFRPGNLVSQREIARITGNSLPSVREALKLLEAEGVVTLIPKRGVAIREMERKEIRDAYHLRILIELDAVAHFVKTVSADEILAIRAETLRLIDQKVTTPQEESQLFQQRMELDHQLHRKIVAALSNDLAKSVHRNIETIMLLSRLSLPPYFHAAGPALMEHLELLEMIEKRDVDGARRSLRAHLESACERAVNSALV